MLITELIRISIYGQLNISNKFDGATNTAPIDINSGYVNVTPKFNDTLKHSPRKAERLI